MISVILIFLISEFSISSAQCSGRTKSKSSPSGTILSPDYPASYDIFEYCRWKILSDRRDYAVLVDFKNVTMTFTRTRRKRRCSGKLIINEELMDCFATDPICNTYTSSRCCEQVVEPRPGCVSQPLRTDGLEIKLETSFFPREEFQGFRIEYKVIDCAEPIPEVTTKSGGSRSLELMGNSITDTNVVNTTAHLPNNEKFSRIIINPAAIVVPLVLVIILIAAAFSIWKFNRRNGRKMNANTQTTVASIYQKWSPPGQNAANGNSTSVFTIPVDIPGTGHYECIIEPSCNKSAPTRGEYDFADKGYIDIDNKYVMADMEREGHEYELSVEFEGEYIEPNETRNIYEMADNVLCRTDDNYTLADCSALKQVFAPVNVCETTDTSYIILDPTTDGAYEIPISLRKE